MKLGLARFSHESITFWPGLTTLEDFERYAYHGADILEERRGTETNMGGIIEVCEAAGAELFPVCDTFGGAREPVADEVYDFYVGEMRREFGRVAGELDGILLALQGNIRTESLEETESYVIREIREVVGYDMPIMCSMDLHANVAPALLDWVTVVCAEHCMPHIDKVETGRRAANIMLATLRGEIKPTVAMAKPGVVVPSIFSNTTIPPGKDLTDRLHEWEKHPRVIDVSVFFGFAWADVPQVGMTMVAVTDDNLPLAQEVVDDLARLAWDKRKELNGVGKTVTVSEGVSRAIKRAKHASKPVVVLYPTDRTGDTTFVLQELLSQGAQSAALPMMRDPEAARACVKAGVGNTVKLEIGARTGWRDGGPIDVKGEVLWVGETNYIGRGARSYQLAKGMWRRDQHINRGSLAIIKVDGVLIQFTSYKCSLTNDEAFTLFGYDPRDFDIIAAKTKSKYYSDISEETILVDMPSQCPLDLTQLTWRNVPPGVYPITGKTPRAKCVTYISE